MIVNKKIFFYCFGTLFTAVPRGNVDVTIFGLPFRCLMRRPVSPLTCRIFSYSLASLSSLVCSGVRPYGNWYLRNQWWGYGFIFLMRGVSPMFPSRFHSSAEDYFYWSGTCCHVRRFSESDCLFWFYIVVR